MLSIEQTSVQINEAKIKTKPKGDSADISVVLKLEFELPNTVLNGIDTRLMGSLYSDTPNQGQPELPMTDTTLPFLKFGDLKPLDWKYKGIGYKITIYPELKARKELLLELCTISNVKIDSQDGGTVKLVITVETDALDEKTLGRIAAIGNRKSSMSLLPPTSEELADITRKQIEEADVGEDED